MKELVEAARNVLIEMNLSDLRDKHIKRLGQVQLRHALEEYDKRMSHLNRKFTSEDVKELDEMIINFSCGDRLHDIRDMVKARVDARAGPL